MLAATMIVELGVNLMDQAGTTLLVGFTTADVERLRAGEELSIKLKDAGLILFDDESATLTIAFGGPKQPRRLVVDEGSLRWMRETTPLSDKLADLGFSADGKVVTFHRETDAETAAAVEKYKQMLARTMAVDTSVVTVYELDKATHRVSVQRFERKRSVDAPARAPNWTPVLACSVGSIAAIAGGVRQPDAVGRVVFIAIALVLAGAAAWMFRAAVRRSAGRVDRG